MIIHIKGRSGSGKTTLGKKLLKKHINKIVVIDTDDIDDPNRLKILKNYDFEKNTDFKKWDNDTKKLNKTQIKKILKDNKDKIIIFVGFFHIGMDEVLKNKVDYSYFIEIDGETLWRQYNSRTLNALTKNKKEIDRMIKNKNLSPFKIHMIMNYKFGIRNGFDCGSPYDLVSDIKQVKKNVKKNGDFMGSSNDIFKDINNKIKNLK